MRVITIFVIIATFLNSARGCGVGHQNTLQTAPSTILWTVCCLNKANNNVYNCVDRKEIDAANPILSCTMDQEIMYLTCLEIIDPVCSLSYSSGSIILTYNGKTYDTNILNSGAQLIIMQNRVSRSQFFSKPSELLEKVMFEHKFADVGDNNYWIGLDQINYLTMVLGLKTSLMIYINSTSSINIGYDIFQVSSKSSNYVLWAAEFLGQDNSQNLFSLSRNSPSGQEFRSTNDFVYSFCSSNVYNSPTAWWYNLNWYNGQNILCSDTVLTTDDGVNGWGTDPISGAIMAISFSGELGVVE